MRATCAIWKTFRPKTSSPPDERFGDLNALLRISKAVNSVRGLEALEKQVLESIFEVAPADRAAILLCQSGTEEWTSVFGWDRRSWTESGRASQPDHRRAGAFRRRGHAL